MCGRMLLPCCSDVPYTSEDIEAVVVYVWSFVESNMFAKLRGKEL
jgi:hypothetical protein